MRSVEFENKNRPPGGWWNWKEEKDALEALLLTGEVMIARRQNFQRVYDLRERVLPGWDEAALPSTDELRRTLTLRTVKALGIALPAWVPDYYRQPKKGMPGWLELLANRGAAAAGRAGGVRRTGLCPSRPVCAARTGRLRQPGSSAYWSGWI